MAYRMSHNKGMDIHIEKSNTYALNMYNCICQGISDTLWVPMRSIS